MTFHDILVDENFLIAILSIILASFLGWFLAYFILKIITKIKNNKSNQQYRSLETYNCVFCNGIRSGGWVQIVIHKKDSHLVVVPVHNDCLRKSLHKDYAQQINV